MPRSQSPAARGPSSASFTTRPARTRAEQTAMEPRSAMSNPVPTGNGQDGILTVYNTVLFDCLSCFISLINAVENALINVNKSNDLSYL